MNQTQEPITTDVPLGLDEPAPILVWRSGIRRLLPIGPGRQGVMYVSEKAAIVAREYFVNKYPHEYVVDSEPFRTPLQDGIRHARSLGCSSLCIWDDSLRIIEEYPL